MWIFLLFQVTFLACYLAGTSTFQKPLSPEEEEYYLKRYKEGDKKARTILIERNMRLVAHIVRKYSASAGRWETDDLISVGAIGLIKGIETFDPDKKAKLSTYLAKCVENELLMLLRSDKKTKQEVSLQDPIGQDKEGNTITLIDVLEDRDDTIMERGDYKMSQGKLYQAVNKVLTGREREVIIMRYGLAGKTPMTQREVAKVLDISRSYVSRIEKKAIQKLSREMTGQVIEWVDEEL